MGKNTIKLDKSVCGHYYLRLKTANGEDVIHEIFRYLDISFEKYKDIMDKRFSGRPSINIKERQLMDKTYGIKRKYLPKDELILFWYKADAVKAMKWIKENANIELDIVEEKKEDKSKKKGKMSMLEIIRKIANILEQMKGFDTGYTTGVKDKMLLDYEGKRYILSIKEIEEPSEDMSDDLDKIR